MNDNAKKLVSFYVNLKINLKSTEGIKIARACEFILLFLKIRKYLTFGCVDLDVYFYGKLFLYCLILKNICIQGEKEGTGHGGI